MFIEAGTMEGSFKYTRAKEVNIYILWRNNY